jgi:hypothetical protein
MSLQDAANLVTVQNGERAILNDPSLSDYGRTKALMALHQAAAYKPPQTPFLTPGDIIKGGIGAGLGYGASTILGSMLGVTPSTLTTFQRLGMGLGTLLNTGLIMNKTSSAQEMKERHDAFRLGFVKAALDLGLLKESGFVAALPITEAIKAPVDLGMGLASSAASTGGALMGQMFGEDSSDANVTQMAIQQRQLEAKANQLQSGRKAALLKRVLDKRLGR